MSLIGAIVAVAYASFNATIVLGYSALVFGLFGFVISKVRQTMGKSKP